MNVALWIVAGLLAAAYLAGGGYKVITPKERISAAGASRPLGRGLRRRAV
ncbi:hypothetical protein ACQ4WX_19715 [Streptomyces lasalocidi]